MPGAGRPRQEDDLVAYDLLDAIGHLDAAVLLDVAPDLDEVVRSYGCQNVAWRHSGWDFKRFR